MMMARVRQLLSIRSYLPCYFADVSGLYPVIVIPASCHPVCLVCPPQTVEHGFPHQPSALCFSPSLQLLAIGTRSGAIKLYP